MRLLKTAIAALTVGAAIALAAGAATAMPLNTGGSSIHTQATNVSPLVDVQFRRRGGPGWGPAIGLGIGAAVIGGMIAAEQAQAEAAAAAQQDAIAYCMQRFRSYNPETGMYVGRDGRARPCP